MLSTKDLDNLLLEYDLESDPDYGVSYVYCLKCLQETGHSKRFRVLKQRHFDYSHSDECYTLEDYKNEFTGVKTICDEYSKFLSEKGREQFLDMWDNLSPEERKKYMSERFGTFEERSERNKKRWDNYTPEERERVRERTKKMWENFTPEEREKFSKERSENTKNIWNNFTPEERQNRLHKTFGTSEEISERTKKRWENYTPEEREDFINKLKEKKRINQNK